MNDGETPNQGSASQRLMVAFRMVGFESCARVLSDHARIGPAVEYESFDPSAPLGLAGAPPALVMPRLGLAVVNGTGRVRADLASAMAGAGSEILAVEPERQVTAFGGLWDMVGRSRRVAFRAGSRSRDAWQASRHWVPGGALDWEFEIDRGTWGLRATDALASNWTGSGIPVAVLDTGVAFEHPDLAGRIARARSFVAGHDASDRNGHGTHVAGILAGPVEPSASRCRYGVAPGVTLCVGKVLDDDGRGCDSSILSGIEWAVSEGCRVVSLSLGSPNETGFAYSRIYEIAAQRALAAGTLVIAAAGNHSDRPNYVAPMCRPANCPSVLAVGAISPSLSVASFSNGGGAGLSPGPDLSAPGVGILSCWGPTGLLRLSGTSMAAPFVAGIAAHHIESSGLTGRALWQRLVADARELADDPVDVGAGLVRAPR